MKSSKYLTMLSLATCCIYALPVSVYAFPPYTSATSEAYGDSNLAATANRDLQLASHNNNTPSSVQSTSSESAADAFGDSYTYAAAASASAEMGRIRMFGTAAASAIQNYQLASYAASFARGFAEARWDDNFTIDGGARNGQIGHLSAGFLVDGHFAYANDASVGLGAALDEYFRATLRLVNGAGSGQDLFVGGGQRHQVDFHGDTWGTYSNESFRAPGLWPVEFDFEFGTPIQISMWGDLKADATAYAAHAYYPDSTIMAIADFSHTMTWNGIAGITDSAGNPVTNYTVSSESGFDYRFSPAVPEPSSAALLALGIGFLFAYGGKRVSNRIT